MGVLQGFRLMRQDMSKLEKDPIFVTMMNVLQTSRFKIVRIQIIKLIKAEKLILKRFVGQRLFDSDPEVRI